MADIYYRDFTQRVLELMRDNFGSSFHAYYEGDPALIGESSLPAICVLKNSSKVAVGPTGFDEIDSTYTLKLIMDKRQDYGASQDADLTDRRLRLLMEGRSDSTGLFLPESIVGVLRTNFSLGDTFALDPILDQNLEVRYWVVPRPSATDENMITMEAHLTLNVREYIQIPNRV